MEFPYLLWKSSLSNRFSTEPKSTSFRFLWWGCEWGEACVCLGPGVSCTHLPAGCLPCSAAWSMSQIQVCLGLRNFPKRSFSGALQALLSSRKTRESYHAFFLVIVTSSKYHNCVQKKNFFKGKCFKINHWRVVITPNYDRPTGVYFGVGKPLEILKLWVCPLKNHRKEAEYRAKDTEIVDDSVLPYLESRTSMHLSSLAVKCVCMYVRACVRACVY